MTRNELLFSIGFDKKFIDCLDQYEESNPEIIEIKDNFVGSIDSYIDSSNNILNFEKSTFYNELIIEK